MAVRRSRRSAPPRIEGITHAGHAEAAGGPRGPLRSAEDEAAGSVSSPSAPRLSSSPAPASATAAPTVFGQHQVGTEYPNGLQVSDDQVIKPLGERLLTKFGKFMGSTLSPRRALPRRDQHRQVGGPADLRPVELQARSGRSVRRPSSTRSCPTAASVRKVRTYSPDGKFLWLSETERPDPVRGQRRRHTRCRDARHRCEGQRPVRTARASPSTPPTVRRCTSR